MAQKILVIDDDPYLRDIYQETLEDAGYEVETSNDGEDGLTKLKQGGFSLCLLDIMLPTRDGLGVLDGINAEPPKIKNGPIIILSNLSHEKLIADAMKRGAAAYLIKADNTPDMLLATVKMHIPPEKN